MITALGTGSGIDLESIITQLMELERQPVTALNNKRERLDVELSAFGKVKSAMNSLADATRKLGESSSFGPYVATSSDEDVLTATANGGALSVNHEIEVVSLAAQHRMQSEAYASSDATIDQRTHDFSSGANSFSVTVDGTNDTLEGLRDAINNHADNTSIDASILNVDGGSRLILTARAGGTDNEIDVQSSGFLLPAEFSELTAASDARIRVDGLDVTRSTNEINDVIDGVTLNLLSAGISQVTTKRDVESLATGLQEFATQYNALRDELNSQAAGEMQGDRLPRNVESRLREIYSTPFTLTNGETITPTEIGFSFDRYGVLTITESELTGANAPDLERYIELFTREEDGIAARFLNVLEEYTAADGLIANREDGIDAQQRRIDTQVERMEYRLDKTEARLRQQYSAMDQLVADLNSTSSYLANQLAALNNNS